MGHHDYQHHPVLLDEVLEALNLVPDGVYIDATFGRGGHAREILKRLSPQGRLLALDRDPEAVSEAMKLAVGDSRFEIQQGSFGKLKRLIESQGYMGKVNGILLDLGVSSPQLDNPQRGFSFMLSGPLDMRMNPTEGIPVAKWLQTAQQDDIAKVLKEYGEERYARRIARAITAARMITPIETTGQLATLVAQANPAWEKDKHPATRTFLALRIFINRELDELQSCLGQVLDVLAHGGRLVVISFHSLEDRIVKRFMRRESSGNKFPAGVPVKDNECNPRLRRIGGAVFAGHDEVAANPRARSAVMRVAEKIV
jgi:16S rRNA (cytosine1402-N4)-methyltransferase